ncbi:hypothetical protein pb186bvf_009364 [Paramecium bursaria]
MGVPAFFRWLCSRNPKILLEALENGDDFENQNPLIDNLYLDMNGLIHPCSHPEGTGIPVPITFHDMFINIFNYIDQLVDIIRPQKLLYMAIDGVAPRAKLNQQRSRRFRAAQESQRIQKEKLLLRDYWAQQGLKNDVLDSYIANHFDSNQITPGTDFMFQLTIALQYYIYDRMNNNSLFQNLVVIFSDANVPGEGEHKILEFIRDQRCQIGYDQNLKHCFYGADADLIMLALSTHEPWFYIIRETIMANDDKFCSICQQKGHFFMDCKQKDQQISQKDLNIEIVVKKQRRLMINFQIIQIHMLREYLNYEFQEFDLERVVDDFIFLCFLVGNDFLPHIPCLKITDGGIDCLMILYKIVKPQLDDYLTNCGKLNLEGVNLFLKHLGMIEEELIRGSEKKKEINNNRRENQNQQQQKLPKPEIELSVLDSHQEILEKFKLTIKEKIGNISKQEMDTASTLQVQGVHKKWSFLSAKQRYYQEKFGIKPSQFLEFINKIKQSYMEALQWNIQYYYSGCKDWGWYYPYHYAPFAQDLINVDQLVLIFEPNRPLTPFQQLMAVLPPHSAQFLPYQYQGLLKDPHSPIADFYPSDFFVDLKGKKFAWLGEVVLPFIDTKRLIDASQINPQTLSKSELDRNRLGTVQLFANITKKDNLGILVQLEWSNRFQVGTDIKSPLPTMQNIKNNQIVSSFVLKTLVRADPNFVQNRVFKDCNQPAILTDDCYFRDCENSKRSFGGEAVKRIIHSIIKIPHKRAHSHDVYDQQQKRVRI